MVKKPLSSTGTGLIALMILLVVLCVVIMVLDYQGRIATVRNVIQTNVSIPVKTAASWPSHLTTNISRYFEEKSALQQENAKLKEENLWLKANLANQTVLEAEHRRLKLLFDSTATHTRPVMIAEVLDSQIDANKHQIEITKGVGGSAFEGQVAIDEGGLVGQITALTEKTALVSLITDERQRIPVFVERNRLRMIARGSGDLNILEMLFVAKDSDVRVGDKIVTSGLGGRYPRGYSVAVVTKIEESPAYEFMEIEAKPLADLDRVLEVLLISPPLVEETDDGLE